MSIEGQRAVLKILLSKKRRLLSAVARLQILATAIVFATMALAFGGLQTPTAIFISLLSFLLVQVFATRDYAALVQITRRIRLTVHGPYFSQPAKTPWPVSAGVAVREGYFFLLLAFDISWLSHAYLHLAPAESFSQFLGHLAIGPVSGIAFAIFTVSLWVFYAWLFIIGTLYSREVNAIEIPATGSANSTEALQEIWVKVQTSAGDEIYLQGHRLSSAGKQPLILFPGFYQNGYVYHLTEDASLARYLWQNNFDVWIIHPRGTALSDGRSRSASLDDFACYDIPSVINHVYSRTGKKPVFVGHSQGGISAIISLMGAHQRDEKMVSFSDTAVVQRQDLLKGLVVLGSFLDFSFSKRSWLKSFVQAGVCIKIGSRKWRIISSQTLLNFSKKLVFLGTPLSFRLRTALLQSKPLRTILFPVVLLFDFVALLKLWEFLYHVPNVSKATRKILFYKTMDGTFSGILQQFQRAVASGNMQSLDESVNYSGNYQRLKLPISVVAMEYDTLADPVMMKESMFDSIHSEQKFFTVWEGIGHEDHFTNAAYFPQVLEAIKRVC